MKMTIFFQIIRPALWSRDNLVNVYYLNVKKLFLTDNMFANLTFNSEQGKANIVRLVTKAGIAFVIKIKDYFQCPV
jgi:hypothetical protein